MRYKQAIRWITTDPDLMSTIDRSTAPAWLLSTSTRELNGSNRFNATSLKTQMAEELNIIGGLSGAAKTNFTAMLLSSLMNHDREPRFLGFKVNRDLVNQVFFIGLDGGRNVYTPIFRNTGLIREGIPVEASISFLTKAAGGLPTPTSTSWRLC